MVKALGQLIVMAALFLGAWFGLSRIDYVKHMHLRGMSKRMEKKVGKVIMETVRTQAPEVDVDSAVDALNELKERICEGNVIDADQIELHIIRSKEINAFALPGNHIVVYTGLLRECDSASELAGVLSHEMAHLQANHVMKRLMSELGIGALAAIASNGNSATVREIIKTLSTTAFERKQESEADAWGVKILRNARIDPHGFADIMFKIAEMSDQLPGMQWLATHPDSKERAETILTLIDSNVRYKPIISERSWKALKSVAQ